VRRKGEIEMSVEQDLKDLMTQMWEQSAQPIKSENSFFSKIAVNILKESPLGHSLIARDGTIIWVNETYSNALGYKPHELMFKKNVFDITHDIPDSDFLKNLEASFRFGKVRRGQGRYNCFRKQWSHKNGQVVTGICKSNVFTLDGNFSAMMSWVSFEERMGEYSEIAQIRKRDKEAVEIEIFQAENRIRELKIEHERLN